MKKLKLDHKANNLVLAFKMDEKRAKAIDTYVSLSLQKTGQKVSETFAGAIETGVITNREELAFMGMCVGIVFERKTQQLAAKEYMDQLNVKPESDGQQKM